MRVIALCAKRRQRSQKQKAWGKRLKTESRKQKVEVRPPSSVLPPPILGTSCYSATGRCDLRSSIFDLRLDWARASTSPASFNTKNCPLTTDLPPPLFT